LQAVDNHTNVTAYALCHLQGKQDAGTEILLESDGAAIRDDVQTILKNLKEHPDCARLEYWYTPPIHFAVREGNLAATRVLWEAYQYEEVTKLIAMAEDRSHTGVTKTLRDAIEIKSSDSDLRLFKAVESGDINEISRLLIRISRDQSATRRQRPNCTTFGRHPQRSLCCRSPS